jgi:hypothetical protein
LGPKPKEGGNVSGNMRWSGRIAAGRKDKDFQRKF